MIRIETSQGIVDLEKIACILYLDLHDSRVGSSDKWEKVMVVLQNAGGFFLILPREEAEKFIEVYDAIDLDVASRDIKSIKQSRDKLREELEKDPYGVVYGQHNMMYNFDSVNSVSEDSTDEDEESDDIEDGIVSSDIAYDSHRERSS